MGFVSFLLFFGVTTCLIGFFAARRSRKSEADYFLASQSISPYALAFSGVASKYSGFMFSGFIAAAYLHGTMVIWLALGMWSGAMLSFGLSLFRLRDMNRGGWALSIGELISFWEGENRVWLRRAVGLLTIFFLGIYVAAQMKAGGRALEVALEQPFYVGILLTAAVILFYCWSGGIRASIWTDNVQIATIVLSIVLIIIAAVVETGGLLELWQAFVATAPASDQVALFPQNLSVGGNIGVCLYFAGTFGIGFAAVGQPHILIRVMALRDHLDTKKYFLTTAVSEAIVISLFVVAGLATRVIMQNASDFSAELALFLTAKELLPAFAVGFVLAGVFASTVSTADSQIISCSASLVRDLPEPPQESLILAKVGTISVALFAVMIAMFVQESIFSLVIFAWGGLGASVGTVLLLRLFRVQLPEWGALLVMLAGGAAVVIWKISGLSTYINESTVGFAIAFGVFFLIKLFVRQEAHPGD